MKDYKKIFKDLASVYKEQYPYKEAFSCKKLFKYEIEELEDILKDIDKNFEISNKKNEKVKTTTKTKESNFPENIDTFEKFRDFYYENMIYDRANLQEKKKIINNFKADDFKRMYKILKGSNTRLSREKILEEIQKSFDDIENSRKI